MTVSVRDLCEVKTSAYRPPGLHLQPWAMMSLPLFSVQSVEMMRRDSQVRLGLSLKTAPLLKMRCEITGRPDIKQFIADTITKFWTEAMPDVMAGLLYTRAGGEVVCKVKDGKVHFDCLKPVYPQDIEVLTKKGEKWGIELPARHNHKPIILEGMKSFVYVHKREFGSWVGQSELEGAYAPWLEKTDRSGAIASRKLWFFKNSFDSGIIFYPPGDYQPPGGGERIPYRDLARQSLEMAQAGGVWAFENVLDDKGNPLWRYERPTLNGGGEALLEYPRQLDTEILRGMEIPDDVLSQNSGTGSFAGRTIPLMAFFVGQNVVLLRIFNEFKRQVLEPLVWLNFESHDWDIHKVEIDNDALMPGGAGQGGVAPVAGSPPPPEVGQQPAPDVQQQQMSQILGEALELLETDDGPEALRALLQKGQRQFSAEFDESKHPRGQPGNAGEFAKGRVVFHSTNKGAASDLETSGISDDSLNKRDSGFFGAGFYASHTPQNLYGNSLVALHLKPDAKVLDVGALRPDAPQAWHPKFVESLERRMKAHRPGIEQSKVDTEIAAVTPGSPTFSHIEYAQEVSRFARSEGFDAVAFAGGQETVLLNKDAVEKIKHVGGLAAAHKYAAKHQPPLQTQLSTATATGHRWVTVGAKDHHGGTPVELDGYGRITKGPKSLKGRLIGRLKEPPQAPETHKPPKSKVEHAAHAAAEKHGLPREHIEHAMHQVHQSMREAVEAREAGKAELRKRTGINAGNISWHENAHRDYSSVPGFDTAAQSMAHDHPELGLGHHEDPTGEYSQRAWDMLREGKKHVPEPHSEEVVNEAVEIARAHQEHVKKQKEAKDTDFDFGANKDDWDGQFSAGNFDESKHPRAHDGKFTGKGADRKFQSAGEAIRAGKSIASWRNEASDAFVKEEIDDDHPAYQAILHHNSPTTEQWNDAKALLNHHVRFYNYSTNRHHFGQVTDVSHDGKSVIVEGADGTKSKHSTDTLSHLGAVSQNKATRKADLSEEAAYLGPHLAKEAFSKGENISVTMRRHGIDPVDGRQIRKAIMEAGEKIREEQSKPSPARAAAQGKSSSKDHADLLKHMRAIEPGADRGALVTFSDTQHGPGLRSKSGLSKEEFDKHMMVMALTGKIDLHRHDYVAPLSKEELADLIYDPRFDEGGTGDHPKGRYYVGAAIRQGG